MDIICLRPFDFSEEVIFAWESEKFVNNGVLKFPAHHPMVTMMAKVCDDVNLFQPIDRERTVIKKIARKIFLGKKKSRIYTVHTEPGGPWYFTRFLMHYDMIHLAKPKEWFYPLPFERWKDVFIADSGAEKLIEASYAVHLWNTAYFRTGTDKNALNTEGTLMGRLKDRFLQV